MDPNIRISTPIITGIIISGWILSVLMILVIIGSSVYLQIVYPTAPLPDTLREWFGIAFGFLFGNFFNIIKDYLQVK